MQDDQTKSDAKLLYKEAHVAQYKDKDLLSALALYKQIVAAHPDDPEAGYSRSQIHNIATNVIPKQELMEVHVKLVMAHLEQGA